MPRLDVRLLRQMYGKLEKLTERLLGECNLLPSILTLRFTNCVKFNFGRSYLPSDSHTNTVISDRFAYPSKWRILFTQLNSTDSVSLKSFKLNQ